MTAATLRKLIEELGDDAYVLIPTEFGFTPACEAESELVNTPDGHPAILLWPCGCNEPEINVDLEAGDFPDPSKN